MNNDISNDDKAAISEVMAKAETLAGQMDACKQALDDLTNTAIQGAKSILLDGYTQLLLIEIQKGTKFFKANWLTKWYHKRIYRKAKYKRIKLQRFIKQNYYNNDRSDNR